MSPYGSTISTSDTPLPSALAEIADDFRSASNDLKLQLLLEFSDELPDLPARYADAPEKLEQVHECQSPLFLAVEVAEEDGVGTAVHLINERLALR